jgi:hypothetical protein
MKNPLGESLQQNEQLILEIDLSFLSKYRTRDPFEKYGCIVYFNIKKEPIAIYWCHGQKFVYPNEEDWSHVKYVFRSSLITAITLKDHLVEVHWIISNTLVFATIESFDVFHPIKRLLTPHIYYTMNV